jgi:predicted nucleotidyltransferase
MDRNVVDKAATTTALTTAASDAAALRTKANRMLREAARDGQRSGMTQREIAAAMHRSQPEIARLLRFQPTSERGMKLMRARKQVIEAAKQLGFTRPRVFGSVARGDDDPTSDIDLLFTPPDDASLFTVGTLVTTLERLLASPVDVVLDRNLTKRFQQKIAEEVVPL